MSFEFIFGNFAPNDDHHSDSNPNPNPLFIVVEEIGRAHV